MSCGGKYVQTAIHLARVLQVHMRVEWMVAEAAGVGRNVWTEDRVGGLIFLLLTAITGFLWC